MAENRNRSEMNSENMFNVEEAVRERYSGGAIAKEPELCCPTAYDPRYLGVIPEEVLERDYGCGDPSRYLIEGDTVLDLGSGAGKMCFIASQVVGPTGKIIGVDVNDGMLAVARRNAPLVSARIGYANVSFKKGQIQDLRLDLEVLEGWLRANPVGSCADLEKLESQKESIRRDQPLVQDHSIDVVISNCVLNLVSPQYKRQLFSEIFRVLRRGGRAIISDIVSDEEIPLHLQNDPTLWSGCISGALREDEFLRAFEDAGFYGITVLARETEPWRTVEGIEFRSITVAAYKGKEGDCWDNKQAVIYKGPFKQIEDDDGHVLRRGVRVAVCEKTFNIYSREPYRDHFAFVEPLHKPESGEVRPFACSDGMLVRSAKETKGHNYKLTKEATSTASTPSSKCC
jgi:arsenite methyltransferase